jgi:hypothetical protein
LSDSGSFAWLCACLAIFEVNFQRSIMMLPSSASDLKI